MFFDDDWGLKIISFFFNIRCSFTVQNRGFGPLEPPFASPGVQSQERLIGRNGRKKRYQGADELRVHPAVPRGIQFKVRLRKTRMLGKGEAIICLLVETNDSYFISSWMNEAVASLLFCNYFSEHFLLACYFYRLS